MLNQEGRLTIVTRHQASLLFIFAGSARMRPANLLALISRLDLKLQVARPESGMTGGDEPKKSTEPHDQIKPL
jgi:hypothetical protein